MDSYLSEFWWAYLTHITTDRCVKISKERCPGCSSGYQTPLLHVHHQASLLDKITSHLNEARGVFSSKFDEMFDDFLTRVAGNCSDDERKVLIKSGRSFLFIITPLSLFYGRYLTEEKYIHLFGNLYNPKSPPPPPAPQKKKVKPRPQPSVDQGEFPPPPKKKKLSKLPQPSSHWERLNLNMYDSDV